MKYLSNILFFSLALIFTGQVIKSSLVSNPKITWEINEQETSDEESEKDTDDDELDKSLSTAFASIAFASDMDSHRTIYQIHYSGLLKEIIAPPPKV